VHRRARVNACCQFAEILGDGKGSVGLLRRREHEGTRRAEPFHLFADAVTHAGSEPHSDGGTSHHEFGLKERHLAASASPSEEVIMHRSSS
jgi:hypothetical protein